MPSYAPPPPPPCPPIPTLNYIPLPSHWLRYGSFYRWWALKESRFFWVCEWQGISFDSEQKNVWYVMFTFSFFLLFLYFSLFFPIPFFFFLLQCFPSFKFSPFLPLSIINVFFSSFLLFTFFFPLLSHSFHLVFCFFFIFSLSFPSHFFIFSSLLNFYLLQLQHLPFLSISTFPFLFSHLSY